MCSRDNIIQSRESVETDQSDRILGNMRIVLSFFRQWGSGTIFLLFSFLRNILQLGFAEFLENINDIICTIDFHGIRRLAAFKRSKFGKTGIQFFRIFYFGDDENDALCVYGNCFDHQRNVICLKTELYLSLLHHITEETFSLLCAVGKLADTNLMTVQILFRQCAADLIVVDFFYFHIITSYGQ